MSRAVTVDVVDRQHGFACFSATNTSKTAVSFKNDITQPLTCFPSLPTTMFQIAVAMLSLMTAILIGISSSRTPHTVSVVNFRAAFATVLAIVLATAILGVHDCEIIDWFRLTAFPTYTMAWLLIVCHSYILPHG
jgi:hypothetical protein